MMWPSRILCSGMDYPHSEFPSKTYSDATLDLPPFDANHRLVALFVVFELVESIELTIR